jgi:hypothetical protein
MVLRQSCTPKHCENHFSLSLADPSHISHMVFMACAPCIADYNISFNKANATASTTACAQLESFSAGTNGTQPLGIQSQSKHQLTAKLAIRFSKET